MLDLDSIDAELVDARTKGFPPGVAPLPLSAIGAQQWNLLRGDLPFPQAVIKASALAHNHAWMRDFTAATGVLLAPHARPRWRRRSSAQRSPPAPGSITVATVQQLGICVHFGVRRVIMANQLIGPREIGE
jgi:D-serine dehydratase